MISEDSVMRSVNGSTESDVNTAVAVTLKYAPERSGGGGRTASTTKQPTDTV